MCVHLKFNYQKATQALNFFATKEGGEIEKLKALKLIFFADKYHLRKFGRPITNDEYYAMKLGPVASGVKDIAENSSFLDEKEELYSTQFLNSNRLCFSSKREVDSKVFSRSDIEALEFAWEKFGHFDKYRLCDLTHLYPEWQKHESALDRLTRVKMSFEDFLADPVGDVEKCYVLNDEQKQDIEDHLKNLSKLEAQWA
ncbi:SocA family protein [Oryzomonas sagensis]|uniref:SocA family protein n=1 Tax=Oryzomonas sagensis TaxID=2603857 RepID=A0ABQ6TQX2_9BACT|nr:Panacea domain-containing protein [Oryzomonas sagensis]KAB0671127.1 SocA family protein [Oryzomonas sagensis]